MGVIPFYLYLLAFYLCISSVSFFYCFHVLFSISAGKSTGFLFLAFVFACYFCFLIGVGSGTCELGKFGSKSKGQRGFSRLMLERYMDRLPHFLSCYFITFVDKSML